QCLADLISGKSKFHNVFHYPTKTWGDVGVIAWLVDAAAIISQKALLKCSYAPYARIMKKICWEESFHILHGRDVVLTMMNGTGEQRELVQEAVTRWWGPLMPFQRNPIAKDEAPMDVWRIRSQGHAEAGAEVFRQGKKGSAFAHAGSVEAPDITFAQAFAHEQYGRRQESEALWVVPRDAIHEVHDFYDELHKTYHRVDGYPLKEKLRVARE